MSDEREVRHFIERLAMVLITMGFPPMPARVWVATLLAEDDTVTAGEIGDRLGVSPAAVSGAVQYLLQVGLITRVPVPGSRRQHFHAAADEWAHAFLSKQRGLGQFSELAATGVDLLGADTVAGGRMAELREFFDFIEVEMSQMLERWLVSRDSAKAAIRR